MNNTINRLIIIGNGFDLAHGMKTKYKDFVNGYLRQRIKKTVKDKDDKLIPFVPIPATSYKYNNKLTPEQNLDEINHMCKVQLSTFFKKIIKDIEDKNWVDIEYAYYEYLCGLIKELSDEEDTKKEVSKEIDGLNEEMKFITKKLVEYLKKEDKKAKKKYNGNAAADKEMILEIIRPLRHQEIAVSAEEGWKEFVERREDNFHDKHKIGIKLQLLMGFYCDKRYQSDDGTDVYKLFPGKVFLLNFNYTTYIEPKFRDTLPNLQVGSFDKEQLVCHIHGDLNDENSIIFGYGDDSDEMYKKLSDKNDNRFLENDKTVKYLGSARYRNFLGFIESAPFQVCIMGHSCGVSDRTLLSTIFQHENCVSIKPYYHKKENSDDYYEIIKNISRCFDDKKLMRDRVVNKEYCEPLPQPGKK